MPNDSSCCGRCARFMLQVEWTRCVWQCQPWHSRISEESELSSGWEEVPSAQGQSGKISNRGIPRSSTVESGSYSLRSRLYFGLLIGAGALLHAAKPPNDRLFTLQFFHGLGVFRSWPLQYLDTHTVKTFSWEIDPFCNELLDHHHQTQMEHMGDVTQTDFPAFCQQLATQFDTTPHSHNISTPLQRPFSGPRRTSRHISHACRPLPTANGLYGRRSFPIFNRYVSSREGRWWLWITPPKKIDGWKDVSYGPFEKVRSISFREGSNSFKKTTFYRYVLQSIWVFPKK